VLGMNRIGLENEKIAQVLAISIENVAKIIEKHRK
ncbi:MAG: hypothetical protein RI894_2586, partial [Bacteroidota bacterium]